MKDWYVRESRLCTSDGEPVPGTHVTYHVYDNNDKEICSVFDLKTALLIAAAPNLKEYIEKIAAGDKNAIQEAAEYIRSVPERHT